MKYKNVLKKIQVQNQGADFRDDQSNFRGKLGQGPRDVMEGSPRPAMGTEGVLGDEEEAGKAQSPGSRKHYLWVFAK